MIELEDPCTYKYGYPSADIIKFLKEKRYEAYFVDFEYPCDHLFVPQERVEAFEKELGGAILSHDADNDLNHNFSNGVVKKIVL